ncbi:hypothetical protein CEXT_585111, partial [Caerostris extrusa]
CPKSLYKFVLQSIFPKSSAASHERSIILHNNSGNRTRFSRHKHSEGWYTSAQHYFCWWFRLCEDNPGTKSSGIYIWGGNESISESLGRFRIPLQETQRTGSSKRRS